MKMIQIGLTYDDVLLVPQRSKVAHRSEVNTRTQLTKNISLNIPFVSANMDTVTEHEMAIALAHAGGIGIIHRFMTIDRQVAEVEKVKRHAGFVLDEPFTLLPDNTIADAREKAKRTGVESFVIIDTEEKVIGILTRRDILFVEEEDAPVEKYMTPYGKLVFAPPGTTLKKATDLIRKHKIEKLPLVDDDGFLKGLVTSKSIEYFYANKNATKDKYGRMRVGAAIGAVGDYTERAKALIEAGADVLVVDVAHGHNEVALKAVEHIRKRFKYIDIIGGNVATPEGVKDLAKIGADAVKVGIGPGGLCTTRIVAGVGIPQFSAVSDCSEMGKKLKVPVIADGGTNYPGDLVKALAAGANACMLAGWFAGTDESPGGIILRNGMKFKVHRGAASFLSVADRKLASEEITDVEKLNTVVAEGVEAMIPYKGAVSDVIYQLLGALRSGMSYCNAMTIGELHRNAEFVRITEAGFRESKSHNVNEI